MSIEEPNTTTAAIENDTVHFESENLGKEVLVAKSLDLNQVSQLFENGQIVEAEFLLLAFLNESGVKEAALFEAAELCMRHAQPELAKVAYNAILNVNPLHLGALGRLGDMAFQQNKFSLATDFYRQIIDNVQQPPNWAYVGLGNAFERMEDYQKAAECLAEAPDSPLLALRIGMLKQRVGLNEEAIIFLEKANLDDLADMAYHAIIDMQVAAQNNEQNDLARRIQLLLDKLLLNHNEFYLDTILNANLLSGWLRDKKMPNRKLTLELLENGKVITSAINDLGHQERGMGGFAFSLPHGLQDGKMHTFTLRLKEHAGYFGAWNFNMPLAEPAAEIPLHPDACHIEGKFDSAFYLAGFAAEEKPLDPVSHYLEEGWLQGRDPAPWFSTLHYLAMHPDVAAAGINPFTHYCIAGEQEGRQIVRLGRNNGEDVFKAHAYATSAGPHFEEFDPNIGAGRSKRTKVIAYYLPQFHAVPVNDKNWGNGFTEWRNLPRGMPQFDGHILPRIPRDLGCYDLSDSDVMRRQIDMAKAAGIHGFCFYHYWFDGKRVLERPMERLLLDPTLDFPFCLMWANENWTKTWDGAETNIILKQSYREKDTIPFIDDLARHMKDPRYIRIGNKPLFFIYRPGHIPAANQTLADWRRIFKERHGLEPLIFQAQAFGDNDPRKFGLDGAIEFPPHKVMSAAPEISSQINLFSKDYSGNIRDYSAVVEVAMSEATPEFPLIRTIFPSWDNEARRPGRGTIIARSTPEIFAKWMEWAVSFSQVNRTYGDSFICVNAWNEWAEGAYLEPDVHFGAAYLNALSRVVHGVLPARQGGSKCKVLLVGHDILAFGAQRILVHIGETLQRQLGVEVSFLILDSNRYQGQFETLTESMSKIGEVLLADQSGFDMAGLLKKLAGQGYQHAITNTTIAGLVLPFLKKEGFMVLSLVHELPTILSERRLEEQAGNIATLADHVIFPAGIVRKGFEGFAGKVNHEAEVFPQGLYNMRTLEQTADRAVVMTELGLTEVTKIVLGVGYGDMRKGIDRFFAAALSLCARRTDLAFVWVGALSHDSGTWLQAEIEASGMGERVRIMGHREDAARFYTAADVYYLSSREDPFPSVVLEALAAGLPVVGHQGCGGSDELIARYGTLVSGDSLAVMDAICAHLDQTGEESALASQARRQEIEDNYRYDKYAFGLLQRLMPDLVSVSAVVPNYNYAPYIGSRLLSVFDQTYPLREVVVLDDASPDNSVEVISSTAAAAKREIQLHVNETNSGSPFPQWFRGVSVARGDYVWIAEADDLATPEMVGQLVTRMQASGAVLGFCDSRQMDENDEPLGDSYKSYVNQIEAGAFYQGFDMDGPEFLARYLSVKNVILNVSGVVFRRDALLDAFRAVGDGLFRLRVAGDWRLYLELCRVPGHRVSYLPDPMNAHRRHKVSVTHALNVKKHLAEIRAMQELAGQLVALSPGQRRKQEEHLKACRLHLTGKES